MQAILAPIATEEFFQVFLVLGCPKQNKPALSVKFSNYILK